jgi:hypothetical protein
MENALRNGTYNIHEGSRSHLYELTHMFMCTDTCVCDRIRYKRVCNCVVFPYTFRMQHYDRRGRVTHVDDESFCLHTWLDAIISKKHNYFDKLFCGVIYSMIVGGYEILIRTFYDRTFVAAELFEYENNIIFRNMRSRAQERSVVARSSTLPKDIIDAICDYI